LPELSLNYIYELYDDVVEGYMSDIEYNSVEAYMSKQEYYYSLATAFGDAQWHHEFMDSELAWELTTGEGVVIAIIDSGIDIDHPKFTGRILPNSYNAYTDKIGLAYVRDDHSRSHGTHVAGIAAAAMQGDSSICGIAPDASILAIKATMPDTGYLLTETWVRGLNYAVENGAHIVNMSFGSAYSGGSNALEQNAIASAVARGVTIVCSAGNAHDNHAGYPAAYPESLAIAALGENGLLASYSNTGPEIDVAAPGSLIYSTVTGGYNYLSGTSMASPNVTGVAALIKSRHPEYTPEQIRDVLRRTARKASLAEKDERYGYGLLNAYTAALGDDATLYTVTFDFNDGVRVPFKIQSVKGIKLARPYHPIREGYVFGGWFTAPAGGDAFDFSTRISADITLYAKWGMALQGMFCYEFPDPGFCNEVLDFVSGADNDKTPMSFMTADDFALLAKCGSINIANRDVQSLRGIACFTGLSSLNCSNNRLTELDLSENRQLTVLDCSGNLLTELDLATNMSLRELYCSFNSITKLDVSKNNELRFLNCSYTMLEKLDVSGNPMLQLLNCNFNHLTELDVSGNPIIQRLECFENMLVKLDVTGTSRLRYLYCEYNRLTELDVSDSLNLLWFTCFNNQLKEMDLSNQQKIDMILCQNNQLSKLIIPQDSQLDWLLCQNNHLTELDLVNNTSLSLLYCYHNFFKSTDYVKGWQLNRLLYLGQTFLFAPQYTGQPPVGAEITPYFTDPYFLAAVREITSIAVGPIFDYDVCSIVNLNIASKNIADLAGIECFANLTRLECQNNRLTSLDISSNTALTYLNCSYNDMKTPADVNGWEQQNLKLGSSFIFYLQNSQHLVETPIITKQPANITVGLGGVATLTVEAEVSQGILSYQWYGQSNILPIPILGETNSTYTAPTNVIGTKRYYCQVTNTDDAAIGSQTASAISNLVTVTVTAEPPPGYNITGLVKTYSPKHETTLQLYSSGAVPGETTSTYTTYISAAKSGSGQSEQNFSFAGVEPGTYTLVISKPAHADFIVHNIVVENQDVDLKADKRPEVQLMTLRCGDINGDGNINNSDLTILWRQGNYNRSAEAADEPLCDLNGDGLINNIDLTILWLAYNYNRGAIEIF
jgi:uncharacterized repeat protein (TIGR02543 family)